MPRAEYMVTNAEVVGSHRLRLTFNDGTVGVVDFSGEQWDGVLAPLADPDFFAQLSVDHEAGTVVWPNGVDLAPEVLYEEARAGGGAA